MCDIRTAIGTKYKTSPYGSLEEITDSRLAYILPDDNGRITLENEEGSEVFGSSVYELFEKSDFDPLLTVKKGHSALIGKCTSFVKKVGKGYVILLGTLPKDDEPSRIIKKAAALASAKVYDTDSGIMVTKRVKDGKTFYIVASVNGNEGSFRFDGTLTDIISGNTYNGSLTLAPYELYILE